MMTFVRAVLEVLAAAPEPFGWYRIEMRLSMMEVSERLRLSLVLAELVERGWVSASTADTTPVLRYSLTQAGRDALRSGAADEVRASSRGE